MKQLKVAFITSTFPSPDKPSLGVFNLRAAKALNEYCDLTVYKLRMWIPGRKIKSEIVYEGIKVKNYAIPMLPPFGIFFTIFDCYISSFFLRNEIRSNQYNLLFSSGINYAGLLCSMISPYAKVKHVAQVIGSDINLYLPKLLKLNIRKNYYEGTHGIISVCIDLKNKANEMLPKITNTKVVYRGIDIEKFKLVNRKRQDDKTQFLYLGGFPKGKGDVGRNLKGGINLITLWKKNENIFKDSNFKILIGGVYSNNKWLVEWRNSLLFPENVELVGNLKPEKAKEMIIESDIILLPSLNEGLPNLAVESAALGRVVLGSNVNGVPEIIKDKVTGIILPANDLNAWKEAMINYGKDKKHLEILGENAREWVCKNFDSKHFAPQVIQFFEETILLNQ